MTTQDTKKSTREPMEHDLKIYSRHFEDVISGKKKAEQRVNDRDFKVGDTLLLREVTEAELRYTGRKIYVTVTHIIHGDGYDILSIEPQDTVSPSEIPEIMRKVHAVIFRWYESRGVEKPYIPMEEVYAVIRPYLRTTEPVSRSLAAVTQKYIEETYGQDDVSEAIREKSRGKIAAVLNAAGVKYGV